MTKTLLIALALATLSVANAATFTVSLIQPAVVKGHDLKAGDYRVDVKDNSVVIGKGKQQFEVAATIQDAHEKFDRTQVLYSESKGKLSIQEIHIGGTATKVTFDSAVHAGE